ncbi:tetratricopeptide repeat protein [Tautonia plasticadhaerens]|uniref:Tetratricopeptide repeat protein n=1 Tax=Tautonia plasticadhaerens TaxID=2527974 RepID=A0A518H639_9BACT|nr:tetratricopeptide repeat protein [Tautonia plasticadhaerens]QDV36306.1 hypothetical protein ElP_42260 [Tautonia plasticadhaerens]
MRNWSRVFAVLMVGWFAPSQAEAQQGGTEELLNSWFQEWAGNPSNFNEAADELPGWFAVDRGRLSVFPEGVRYTYDLPEGRKLEPPEEQQIRGAMTSLLAKFLKSDIDQFFPRVGDAERQSIRTTVQGSLEVVVQEARGERIDPPAPVADEGPVQASPQGWFLASPQHLSSPQLASSPTSTVQTYAPADAYESYWSGRYAEAAARLRGLVEADPDDARAWYFLALSERASGAPARAEASLRRGAVAESRGGSGREVSLALTRVQGPDRQWLEAARSLPAGRVGMDHSLDVATQSYWSGRYGEAAARLRGLVEADPDDARAWYFLALSERASGAPARAEASLRRGAVAESRGGSGREVSLALTRVQGPDRQWLEAARSVARGRPTGETDLASRFVSIP